MYDEYQREPFSEPNTKNKTKFHFNDAIAEQHKEYLGDAPWELRNQWRRFHGYQNGIWNWDWADKNKLFKQDNDRMLGALVSQIGFTRTQKEEVQRLCEKIHYPTYSPYYRVVDIVFYVCVLVADKDYRGDGRIYYPTKKKYEQPRGDDHVADAHEAFVEIVENLNLDTPKGKIEKGLPKFKHIIEGLA